MKDSVYFSVQAWMVTKLQLKGAERDVYAIIYGYSQDEESDFHGSLSYLAELTGYSRNAICTALKNLTDKNLILKNEKLVSNIKHCKYRVNMNSVQATCTPVQATCTPSEKSVQATCINNKQEEKENNKKDNKERVRNSGTSGDWMLQQYNDICTNLPKVRAISDKRKKAIQNIMNKYSKGDITECFNIANESSFLTGHNDRGWKADLDFILREDKFINILEGKYSTKSRNNAHDKLNESGDLYVKHHRLTEEEKRNGEKF